MHARVSGFTIQHLDTAFSQCLGQFSYLTVCKLQYESQTVVSNTYTIQRIIIVNTENTEYNIIGQKYTTSENTCVEYGHNITILMCIESIISIYQPEISPYHQLSQKDANTLFFIELILFLLSNREYKFLRYCVIQFIDCPTGEVQKRKSEFCILR